MKLMSCPVCGSTMQLSYGTDLKLYYECIECGYGELYESEEITNYREFCNYYIDDCFNDEY